VALDLPTLQRWPIGRIAIAAAAVVLLTAAIGGWSVALHYYKEVCRLRLQPGFINDAREMPPLPRPGAQRRIVFVGDSRVTRWRPAPDLHGAQLVWRGIDGETTFQLVGRFSADVIALAPDVVVIASGINDLVAACALSKCDMVVHRTATNLLTVARAAADAGADVYLLTIVAPATPPIWRRFVWSDGILIATNNVNEALTAAAVDGVHVLGADRLLRADSGYLNEKYAEDTLHFSATAYAKLNRLIADSTKE
jgi:lysophospholipase L1-like esterase